jgi:outer membrane protein insertion porin family
VTLPAQPANTSPLDKVSPSATTPESPRHTPSPTPTGTVSTIAPSPVPEGTLGAIVFQGADPFTADELTPITGLTLGTTPTEEALQKASRALIDTGYFYNVSATFGSVAKVGTATFVLQPAPPEMLRRLSFANFVWLTPAEIDDVLKRVPLYHGYGSVPAANNGPLIASIQAALSRALATKGVNAMITHSDVPPNALHPYAAIEFRVTEPRVVLDSASLFDIPPSLVAKTLKAQELAVKQPYNEGIAGTTLTDLLLRPARDAGYIGAKLWRIDRKRRPMGNNVGVIFTARMDAGPLYTVRSLGWVPTPVYSSTDFHRNTGLMAGKPPTPAGLEKTQQSILDAYHSHGYVDAQVLVNSDLDAKSGSASYTFSVNPGPQYTLRSISIQGLPPDVQKEFEAAWTIKPGDVYDENYLLNFINNHPSIKSLKAYTFDYNRSTVPDSHMVDLVITFKPAK